MTELLTCWLMTYGLSFVIALTHGPFGLCELVRYRIIRRFRHTKWIVNGVKCPVCISFWCGMIVAAWTGGDFFSVWLSSVGFVCVVTSLSPS